MNTAWPLEFPGDVEVTVGPVYVDQVDLSSGKNRAACLLNPSAECRVDRPLGHVDWAAGVRLAHYN